ncbi:hypothetical protein [Pseudoalteromonas rhizosphaerae]|uniref:hypothetical protein n=1 Tax=Pseudoalteromonas rhizosphaerae TaxID=2518973 RepID=UPI0012311787|nr:hypothetical protein [Pseudoalteromonas rhizosphaerae]
MVNKIKAIFFLSMLVTVSSCLAIDNPDTPDYVNSFLAEAKVYEEKISQCDCDYVELRDRYDDFNIFLEEKLSHAKRLVGHFVKGEAKEKFLSSQAAWEVFSQKEKEFVMANWTKESFGTSYLLSRLNYTTSIDKQRVITLYYYAKNYPAL